MSEYEKSLRSLSLRDLEGLLWSRKAEHAEFEARFNNPADEGHARSYSLKDILANSAADIAKIEALIERRK